ncbi:MAG: amidohydrolase/deacetylase family metallohydrolase [Candidatus Limnocylindrales bacterium]
MKIDLLVRGGTVIDPASGRHETAEVAIADGRIVEVGHARSSADATDVIEAEGAYVVPGLIDLHVHVYWGVADLSIEPGPNDLARGATTIVDAGSAGANTFPGFRRYVIEPFAGRILAFLNISAAGQIDPELGELHDLRFALVDRAVEVGRANPDLIVGLKVRVSEMLAGENGLAGLDRALEAGRELGLPTMVHIGGSRAPIEEILGRLGPGDIVTHALTGWEPGIVTSGGRVVAAAHEARARGVRFDVGHGAGSFTWANAEAALADGFRPDTISSDLHRFNVDGPVHDLVTTLSKFLHLGLSLPEVIAMATTAPALAIGRSGEIGTLSVGAIADVAVLHLVEAPVDLTDSAGVTRRASARLVAATTIRAGRVVGPAGTRTARRSDAE